MRPERRRRAGDLPAPQRNPQPGVSKAQLSLAGRLDGPIAAQG
jgi:hypothetical protein